MTIERDDFFDADSSMDGQEDNTPIDQEATRVALQEFPKGTYQTDPEAGIRLLKKVWPANVEGDPEQVVYEVTGLATCVSQNLRRQLRLRGLTFSPTKLHKPIWEDGPNGKRRIAGRDPGGFDDQYVTFSKLAHAFEKLTGEKAERVQQVLDFVTNQPLRFVMYYTKAGKMKFDRFGEV